MVLLSYSRNMGVDLCVDGHRKSVTSIGTINMIKDS